MADLTGKTAPVTDGSAGIGFGAAKRFAEHVGRRLPRAGAALIRTWRKRRSGRDYLWTASDFDLRDLGLTRADAQHEAAKPFWTA